MTWERVSKFISQDYEIVDRSFANREQAAIQFTIPGHHPDQGEIDFLVEASLATEEEYEPLKAYKWSHECPDIDMEAVKVAGLLIAYMHGYIAEETFHE